MEKIPEVNSKKELKEIQEKNFYLKKEIQEIADYNQNKIKEGSKKYDPHFENFDIEKLQDEDFFIFQQFKGGKLKEEEFEKWRENILEKEESRKNFSAWLANKIIDWKNYQKFAESGGKIIYFLPDGRYGEWIMGREKDNEGKEKDEYIHPPGVNSKNVQVYPDYRNANIKKAMFSDVYKNEQKKWNWQTSEPNI